MAADDTVQSLATREAAAFTAYRDGDIRAMDELVDLLAQVVGHTARAQSVSEAVAQDAVQTSWLRLVENCERIKDPQAVMGWLIVTVRRSSSFERASCRTTSTLVPAGSRRMPFAVSARRIALMWTCSPGL